MPDDRLLKKKFYECMPLFIALGDEVRLSIIGVLNEGDPEGLNVNEITRQTSLSRPAISHHLKILKDCGFVEVRRSGTSNYYRLTPKECTRKLMELGYIIDQSYER